MDTIKYLEVATSKDLSRYNLQAIYRHKDRMVATDGYRLHLIEELPMVETPHFLNGADLGEFPDYESVIPSDLSQVAVIRLDAKEIKRLKGLIALSGIKMPVVEVSASDNAIKFSLDFNDSTASISFQAEVIEPMTPRNFRLPYLLEAIIPYSNMILLASQEEGRAIMLHAPMESAKAVIMPCRKD